MNVVISGAGVVGCHLAQYLVLKKHLVIVIDTNDKKLKSLEEELDLKILHGHASDVNILQQAEVSKADLFLALTNFDEINLVAAQMAKHLGAHKTVARVAKPIYLNTQFNFRSALGIDLILSPELLTAVEIVRFMDNPDALTLAHFAQGKIRLHQLLLSSSSPFANQQLKEIKLPSGVLVVTVSRQGEVIIPKGNTRLEAGDRITMVGLHEMMKEVSRRFDRVPSMINSIVIAGGGETGQFLAQTLEEKEYNVKLIDTDEQRCHELSNLLRKTTVLHGDVTNSGFIEEERIVQTDVFVAVTGDDETNIMSALLFKEMGGKKCVVKVNRSDYIQLLTKVGIDLVLSPRHLAANKIVTLITRGKITGLSILEEGKVEVIEFQAIPGVPIVGKPLKELSLPPNCLLAAVVHNNVPEIPHGNTVIQPGDTVIVLGLVESVAKAEKLFQP